MNKIKIVCQHCHKIFEVHPYRRHSAQYCSRNCAAKSQTGTKAAHWKGGKIEKICSHCGKSYLVLRCLENINLYCSKSCHSSDKLKGNKAPWWKGGNKTLYCPRCGKGFEVHPGDTRRKYCSKKCLDGARMKRIILTCLACGKQYEEKLSRANRYNNTFCSHKCYTQYSQGEKSHLWQGGKSFEPYPTTFNRQFKRMIRERDNHTCAICGKFGDNVHHIDHVKENTLPENCITICRSCHMKIHHNPPLSRF